MSENGTPTERIRRTVGPVSFSRNVRWFIAALTGFLIFIILFLLLQLQTAMAEAAEASQRGQRAVALAAQRTVEVAGDLSPGRARILLDSIRRESGVVAVELETSGGTFRSGIRGPDLAVVEQRSTHGPLRLYFDSSPLDDARQRFYWIAGLVILATIMGLVLLLLLLPRITRPIDTMLQDAELLGDRAPTATDERYLIETFRSSIETLKRQETELRELHEAEKLRANDLETVTKLLTRNLSSGFIAIDPSGNITRINQAGLQILGIPPVDEPAPFEKVLGETELRRILERSHDEGRPLNRVEVVLPKEVTIGLTTVPVRSEQGESLGTIALFSDLSEVKRLENRMNHIQALASLGEISAGIAHELRNSLSTLMGYLKLATRGSNEDRERRITQAESEGRRMTETVSALLRFARPLSPSFQRVRLDEVAHDVALRYSDTVPIELDLSPAVIDGDPALLTSAVENLIRNAVEALEQADDPRIRVVVTDQPHPEVVVSDNGPGIDPELLPKLFLPFTTGKASGTGMGLALSRKIILQHGGDILMESEPGGGTTATVQFR